MCVCTASAAIRKKSFILRSEWHWKNFDFNKSLKINTPNNNYTKNIDNSLWSYKLSEDNIDSFLVNLKNYFNNCSNFLDKKINQINRKIKNYEHIDYSMTISDIEIFYNIIN